MALLAIGLNGFTQKNEKLNIEKITSWKLSKNTPTTHLILIQEEVIKYLELQPGDCLGTFTIDGQCYGAIQINSEKENQCLTLYGDDIYTTEKDGFSAGEPILIRKFLTQKGIDEILDIQFDPDFPNQGYFMAHGVSAIKTASTIVEEMGCSSKLDFTIFPNPAREQVNVIWNQEQGEKGNIEIFNTYGQRVETITVLAKEAGRQQIKLDVSGFEKGTWMIRLSTGKRIGIKKLVIIK